MEKQKAVDSKDQVPEIPQEYGKQLTEEERLREDKKLPYEEEPIPELVPVQVDPGQIDEARNQAGPSTPRPAAQKTPLASRSSESDVKKLKPTTVKPPHELIAESPESKRLKSSDTTERRLELTQVGDDIFHHLDKVVGQEDLWSYEHETESTAEEAKHDVPEALWSDAPLDRVPPDPPKWIDDLADAVEEWRLKRLGVLSPLEQLRDGYKVLTTRFVRDWRVKPNPAKAGSPKIGGQRVRQHEERRCAQSCNWWTDIEIDSSSVFDEKVRRRSWRP